MKKEMDRDRRGHLEHIPIAENPRFAISFTFKRKICTNERKEQNQQTIPS